MAASVNIPPPPDYVPPPPDANIPPPPDVQAPQGRSTVGGTALQVVQGVNEGVVRALGLPGDLANAVTGLFGFAPGPYSGEGMVQAFRGVAGRTEPQGRAERIAGRVGEEVGAAVPVAAATMGAGPLARGATSTVGKVIESLTAAGPVELAKIETKIAAMAGVGAGVGREIGGRAGEVVGQLVGSFGPSGAMTLVRMARERIAGLLPATTPARAAATVGKELEATIGAQPVARERLAEGARLNREVPGLAMTTEQAVGGVPMASRRAADVRRSPEIVGQVEQQQVGAQRALGEALAQVPGVPTAGTANVADAQAAAARSLAVERDFAQAEHARMSGALNDVNRRATADLQQSIADLGPLANREEAGQNLLARLTAREAELARHEDAMFAKVDPGNTVRVNVGGLKEAIAEIEAREASGLSKGTVAPEIRELAAQLGNTEQLTEAQIAAAMKANPTATPAQIMAQGATAEVPLGTLRRWRSDILGALRDAGDSLTPNHRAVANLSAIRAKIDEVLENPASIVTGDADAVTRYRAAAQVTRDIKQRFTDNTVAAVMQQKAGQAATKRPVEELVGQFFTAGKGAATRAQDLVNAVGDMPGAVGAVRDYALNDFLRVAYEGGTLNTKRAVKWLQDHREALQVTDASGARPFAAIDREVQGIVRQGKRLDEIGQFVQGAQAGADAALKQSLADTDRAAANLFVKADPQLAVAQVLKGADPAAKMRELIARVQGDEGALRGLRRGFWDHALTEFRGAQTDLTGNPLLNPGAMREFMQRNEGAMRALYPPAALDRLRTIQRASEMTLQGTSPSVLPEGAGITDQALYTVSSLMTHGMMGHGTGWVVPTRAARLIDSVIERFTPAELQKVYKEALMDPEVANTLLTMGRARFNPRAVELRLRAHLANLSGNAQPQEPEPPQPELLMTNTYQPASLTNPPQRTMRPQSPEASAAVADSLTKVKKLSEAIAAQQRVLEAAAARSPR